jgi:hypothetical protein
MQQNRYYVCKYKKHADDKSTIDSIQTNLL